MVIDIGNVYMRIGHGTFNCLKFLYGLEIMIISSYCTHCQENVKTMIG